MTLKWCLFFLFAYLVLFCWFFFALFYMINEEIVRKNAADFRALLCWMVTYSFYIDVPPPWNAVSAAAICAESSHWNMHGFVFVYSYIKLSPMVSYVSFNEKMFHSWKYYLRNHVVLKSCTPSYVLDSYLIKLNLCIVLDTCRTLFL